MSKQIITESGRISIEILELEASLETALDYHKKIYDSLVESANKTSNIRFEIENKRRELESHEN
jgi:hypothetical protein